MNKSVKIRVASIVLLALLVIGIFALPAYAATSSPSSVSDVIETAYNEVETQAKDIFFDVIVNALRLIVGIFLVVNIVKCGIARHNGQEMNFTPVIVLFVILIVLIVLPEHIWNLIS